MVSTFLNPSLYLYDTNLNLLKSFNKTYNSPGFGASWLSDTNFLCVYKDGMLKLFNIESGKEIWNYCLDGGAVWGIDILSDKQFLVGDESSIYNIKWEKNVLVWKKSNWHAGRCRCINLNKSKTLLLTGSDDCTVRLMKVENQFKIWEYALNDFVQGLVWVPGEEYIFALSKRNQLVAIESSTGLTIKEFNQFSLFCNSIRFLAKEEQILVGDDKGVVKRFKCIF